MGLHKTAMMERQDLMRQVTPILVQAGALAYCPLHGDDIVLWTGGGEQAAYAFATNAWKKGEIGGDREDVTEAVKAVLNDAAHECWRCVKLDKE